MPGLDGCETTERIRQDTRWNQLPVIALTAGATATEQKRAEAAGMNDFLMKPIDPIKLVRVMREHIERSQGRILPVQPPVSAPPPQSVQTVGCPNPPQDTWPEIAGIDSNDVRHRLRGDHALFVRLMNSLLQESDELLAMTQTALAAHDQTQARAQVHKLRGQAANIGAKSISQTLNHLENQAQAGCLQAEALEPVKEAFEAIKTQWKALEPTGTNELNQEVATNVTLDPEQLDALLVLLSKQKLKALDMFQNLLPTLKTALSAAELDELQAAMLKLNFKVAIRILGALRDKAS